MKVVIKCLLAFFILSLAAGCASITSSKTKSSLIRQAADIPDSFLPLEGVSLDENSCKSPMVDARDGTEIIMVSSMNGKGNYRVPQGKYGVGKGELLRLNCKTGKVIGIVKE